MSFREKIEQLRAKPQKVRERYLYITMIALIPILLALAGFSFFYERAAKEGQTFSPIKKLGQYIVDKAKHSKDAMQSAATNGE